MNKCVFTHTFTHLLDINDRIENEFNATPSHFPHQQFIAWTWINWQMQESSQGFVAVMTELSLAGV